MLWSLCSSMYQVSSFTISLIINFTVMRENVTIAAKQYLFSEGIILKRTRNTQILGKKMTTEELLATNPGLL